MNTEYPPIEKLTDYLNGELSIEESKEIKAKFGQSDESKKELEHLEIIWNLADRLHQMEKVDKQKAKRKVNFRTDRWIIYSHFFQKAAAILILPVLLFSGYLFFHQGKAESTEQEFVAAYGTRSTIVLPDGSKIWLNSGSKLRYGPDFNQDKRTVFLTGEAFFDVEANTSKPFEVITTLFTIQAVGTEFNVFSYERNAFETSLEEGCVHVFPTINKNQNEPVLKMSPGQRVVFDETERKLVLSAEDVSQFSTWREGKLTFKNAPMKEVIVKMGRWFNVDIDLKDTELLKYRYTAVFENETVQQALEMLSFSSPIKYKIVPGERQQDNAFSRSKVEISKNH